VSKESTTGGPPLVPPLLEPLLEPLELPLPEPLLDPPLPDPLLLPAPLLLPLEPPLPLDEPPPSWCEPLDEPLELALASPPTGARPEVSPDPHAQRMAVRAPAAPQRTGPLLDVMHRNARSRGSGSAKWRDSLPPEIAAGSASFWRPCPHLV